MAAPPARHRGSQRWRSWVATAAAALVATATLTVLTPTAALAETGGAPPETVGPGFLDLTTTSPENAEPLSGRVELYRWDEQYNDFYWHGATGVAVPGSTTVELPVGVYFYEANADGNLLHSGLTDDVHDWPTSPDDPGTFEITADQTVEKTAEYRYVSRFIGSMEIPEGRDASSFRLRLFDRDWNEWFTAPVAEDGTFEFPTWWGDYDISLVDTEQEYRTHSFGTVSFERFRDVTVPRVTLQRGRSVPVTGRVLVDGVARAGVKVEAIYLRTDADGDTFMHGDESTVTDAEGRYTLRTLRTTRTYTLAIWGDGVRDIYLGGATEHWWQGDTFSPEADPTVLDDIDAERLPIVTGRIVGPDGDVLAGDVSARQVLDERNWHQRGVTIEEEGEDFRLTLEPGTYQFSVQPQGNNLVAQSGYYGSQFSVLEEEAGHFVLGEDDTDLTIELPRADSTHGLVTGPDGPLENALVTAYAWDPYDEFWYWENQSLTRPDGTWNMQLTRDAPHMLRVARNDFETVYTGGSSTAPDASNPATFVPSGPLFDTGTITMTPRTTDFGSTAGEAHPWCQSKALFRSEDMRKVALPFEINFHGEKTSTLYIQDDGVVSFERSPGTHELEQVREYRGKPLFAPFRSEMSGAFEDAGQVTYGISPDKTQLCISWVEQVPYGLDDLDANPRGNNTFQMILTDASAAPGRTTGDFDLRYNYDVIDWDTWGWETDRPSWVGYTQGTGEDGSTFTLPGSGEAGALVDGGPYALTEGSYRSTQKGRYRFEFRNAGAPNASPVGDLRGSVTDPAGDPVALAQVRVCLDGGTWCDYTFTRSNGAWALTGAPIGTYSVVASRGLSSLTGDVIPGTTSAIVSTDSTTQVRSITLGRIPAPAVPLTVNGTESTSMPVLDLRASTTITFTGCDHTTDPTMSLVGEFGQQVLTRPLTESPAGTYSATFTPNAISSYAAIITNVPETCGDDPVAFLVYIDPAGLVSDQYGRVIEDAEVTLLRADAEGDTFTVVPDGSTIMSPRNRANPSRTDATGYFAWDVVAGWYKVKATAPGCASRTTDGMEVPPERLSLHITLTCDVAAPAPSTKPTLTGTGVEGTDLVATGGTWAAPFAETALEWLRDGVVDTTITGLRHTVRASDVGSVFTVRSVAERPAVTTDGGTSTDLDRQVSFSAATASSAAITATARPTSTPEPETPVTPTPEPETPATPTPVVTPKPVTPPSTPPSTPAKAPAKATAKLTVKAPTSIKAKARAKATITVKAAGVKASQLNGTVTLKVSAPGTKTRTITVKVKNGKATVKLPAYAKGKITVRATWAGNAKVTRATATKKVLKVTAAKRR